MSVSPPRPGILQNNFVRLILAVIGIGIVGFLVIQLIPLDRSNPPVVKEPNWDSQQTRALAVRACFDCHSNETKWPWYAYVAPVSWVVVHDTQEGRGYLNFSDWGKGTARLEQIAEVVQNGSMPKRIYLPMHPEAQLTDAERTALIQGLQKTIAQSQ
jgi:hypothetical protein